MLSSCVPNRHTALAFPALPGMFSYFASQAHGTWLRRRQRWPLIGAGTHQTEFLRVLPSSREKLENAVEDSATCARAGDYLPL
jgi:hypothetical protein